MILNVERFRDVAAEMFRFRKCQNCYRSGKIRPRMIPELITISLISISLKSEWKFSRIFEDISIFNSIISFNVISLRP